MKITLRRSGEGYYRVSSEGAPLLVELPCVVTSFEKEHVVLEVVNDARSAPAYKNAFGIDRTLQLALASEETKLERHATLTPLIQVPSTLPSGPCVGAALLAETRCFRASAGQKPAACHASELAAGARCKVLLDVVGLKRKPETARWHFDVAVSQVLLEAVEAVGAVAAVGAVGASTEAAACPFTDDAHLDLESCVPDEESEYVVPDHNERSESLDV
jgi:hypothetical protein